MRGINGEKLGLKCLNVGKYWQYKVYVEWNVNYIKEVKLKESEIMKNVIEEIHSDMSTAKWWPYL